MIQTSIVALLVLGSSCYAAWRLMPAAARQSLAKMLLELPLPGRVADALRRQASTAGGCGGCGGCAKAPAAAKPSRRAGAPITLHPGPRR